MPWKTAEKVRAIGAFYLNKPRGLCGNDDCGQTSAWYIFSALGFYPVNPANGEYVFGTPLADKAELTFDNGKHFTVRAVNLSKQNLYVQKVTLNGKPYTKTYILHSDLLKGGELVFTMGPDPSHTWGTNIKDYPH